ncbi:MAG: ABC transporter permease [Deltaproteobacteria bacterium]|nr:MAG: ABC transporter permease [Deltaproteobacteria bacterium]
MSAQRRYDRLWGAIPVVAVLALWELVTRLDFVPGGTFFPPFSAVVLELYDLAVTGVLAQNFLPSLRRVLIGLAGGAVAGILVGTAMGWSKSVGSTLGPIISLLYPIPALGWLPLLMIWIGINELLPVAVIFICSFFPICYTTATGIKSVDRRYVQAARTLGSSDTRVLTTVVLPLALPDIFTGLRLEAGMAWRVIIAAEMVAIPTGIGALLMRGESLLRVDTIIACLLVLSVMCFCFERFFILVEHRITEHWR